MLVARRARGQRLEGKWEFPGGKVHDEETPEECLRRELAEEFGVQVQVGEHVATSLYDYGFINIELAAYRASYVGGLFRLTDHDEIRWVAPSGLLELDLAPADVPIAEEVARKAEIE